MLQNTCTTTSLQSLLQKSIESLVKNANEIEFQETSKNIQGEACKLTLGHAMEKTRNCLNDVVSRNCLNAVSFDLSDEVPKSHEKSKSKLLHQQEKDFHKMIPTPLTEQVKNVRN